MSSSGILTDPSWTLGKNGKPQRSNLLPLVKDSPVLAIKKKGMVFTCLASHNIFTARNYGCIFARRF